MFSSIPFLKEEKNVEYFPHIGGILQLTGTRKICFVRIFHPIEGPDSQQWLQGSAQM